MIVSIDTPERVKIIQDKNSKVAEDALNKLIDDYKTQQARKDLGLDYVEVDISSLKESAQVLDNDIKKPSSDKNYGPSVLKLKRE